jgi:hypothetical protein
VTPSKVALLPTSAGIDTFDVIAAQRHFLNLGTPLAGCRLAAADVNEDGAINTFDVIAIQRFFLGRSTGIANTGNYRFSPASRTYTSVVADQTGQNYDTLVFGDAAAGFVHRPDDRSQDAAGEDTGVSTLSGRNTSAGEVPAPVNEVALPEVAIDQSRSKFIVPVTTTAIDAANKLVGFQGDFTFDERVVTFAGEPVRKAGLTDGNWNVSGNVLPGVGPIRTVRLSAFSNDFTPLSGEGTLFELNILRVSKAQDTALIWAAPPDQFIFIDADLNAQKPISAPPGSIAPSRKRK